MMKGVKIVCTCFLILLFPVGSQKKREIPIYGFWKIDAFDPTIQLNDLAKKQLQQHFVFIVFPNENKTSTIMTRSAVINSIPSIDSIMLNGKIDCVVNSCIVREQETAGGEFEVLGLDVIKSVKILRVYEIREWPNGKVTFVYFDALPPGVTLKRMSKAAEKIIRSEWANVGFKIP